MNGAPRPGAGAPGGGAQPSREKTAATTVVEAQELGEQARFRDDALWALDGLAPGASAATQRESLAAFVEIAAVRRGRLALRASGLAAGALAAAAALPVADDGVLALGAAALLLAFCQPDADAAATLARDDVARLAVALLAAPEAPPAAGPDAALAARVLRPIQEGAAYARLLPREARFAPQTIALAALAAALDPHTSAADAEPAKHALRRAGLLEAAAQLAADHGRALVDPAPTMRTVHALWALHRALSVLENACFACPENEARLVAAEVSLGVPPLVARHGVAAWLVQQLGALARQALVPGLKKDVLRVLLAVLMNMTHNNEAGAAAVVAAGGLEAGAALLAKVLQQAAPAGAAPGAALGAWVDELSSCLGLLINLAGCGPDLRRRLRELRLPAAGGAAAGGSATGLVALLCGLISSVAGAAGVGGAAAGAPGAPGASPSKRRTSAGGSEEVTLDSLEAGEGQGAASILEAYAAILAGFLVEGDAAARAEAAALLPDGSLAPVVAAVARCLQFYLTAGAITRRTEDSLRALLAALQAQTGLGVGGVGGAPA